MRVAIIGTVGRKDEGAKMSLALYRAMVVTTTTIIEKLKKQMLPGEEVTLINGGAAWSEHVAISLIRKNPDYNLEVHLPAPLSMDKGGYYGNNDARAANYYHSRFSEKVGANSLLSLEEVINSENKKVKTSVSDGFHIRNMKLAQSDVLIAFSWGDGDIPIEPSIYGIWKISRAATKIHVPLEKLLPKD